MEGLSTFRFRASLRFLPCSAALQPTQCGAQRTPPTPGTSIFSLPQGLETLFKHLFINCSLLLYYVAPEWNLGGGGEELE